MPWLFPGLAVPGLVFPGFFACGRDVWCFGFFCLPDMRSILSERRAAPSVAVLGGGSGGSLQDWSKSLIWLPRDPPAAFQCSIRSAVSISVSRGEFHDQGGEQ